MFYALAYYKRSGNAIVFLHVYSILKLVFNTYYKMLAKKRRPAIELSVGIFCCNAYSLRRNSHAASTSEAGGGWVIKARFVGIVSYWSIIIM